MVYGFLIKLHLLLSKCPAYRFCNYWILDHFVLPCIPFMDTGIWYFTGKFWIFYHISFQCGQAPCRFQLIRVGFLVPMKHRVSQSQIFPSKKMGFLTIHHINGPTSTQISTTKVPGQQEIPKKLWNSH